MLADRMPVDLSGRSAGAVEMVPVPLPVTPRTGVSGASLVRLSDVNVALLLASEHARDSAPARSFCSAVGDDEFASSRVFSAMEDGFLYLVFMESTHPRAVDSIDVPVIYAIKRLYAAAGESCARFVEEAISQGE